MDVCVKYEELLSFFITQYNNEKNIVVSEYLYNLIDSLIQKNDIAWRHYSIVRKSVLFPYKNNGVKYDGVILDTDKDGKSMWRLITLTGKKTLN